MSQAGIVDFEGSGPSGPTTFVTNMGSAITIGGVIEILGSIVDAHGIPLQTTASGNTVTIQTQYASASASSSGTNAGLASFNSTYFTVDSNGYVTLNGSFIMETFQVDASTPPGTNPVYANSGGIITVTGGQVAAGVVGTNVIRTDSRDLYTYTIEIQRSTTAAVSTLADNGVSHFNSAQFTVDGNGFVSLLGTGAVETLTGNTGGAVGPTASNINVVGTGSTTASGNPGTSTLTIELTGLTNHAVLVGAGTATITKVGPSATTGQILQSQGSLTDPAFSTATYPATTTINDILYSSSNNVVGQITASDNGVLISGTTGIPSWLANSATPGFVLTANSGAPASWQSITAEGAITTIDGDSGSMTPTAGVVTISGGTTGLTTIASASTMDLTGTLNVGHGGTGATTLTGVLIGHGTSAVTGNPVTQYDVLVGGASSAIVSLTPGTTSTVLRSGGNAANPAWTNDFQVSSADIMTNTGQPCFMVYLNTALTAVTGDNTAVNIQFDTVSFDQASNITLNSSGKTIFTAPVTGRYAFSGTLILSTTSTFQGTNTDMIHSSGTHYRFGSSLVQSLSTGNYAILSFTQSIIIPMNASDTVYLECVATTTAGTKNTTVLGASGGVIQNLWSGQLVC